MESRTMPTVTAIPIHAWYLASASSSSSGTADNRKSGLPFGAGIGSVVVYQVTPSTDNVSRLGAPPLDDMADASAVSIGMPYAPAPREDRPGRRRAPLKIRAACWLLDSRGKVLGIAGLKGPGLRKRAMADQLDGDLRGRQQLVDLIKHLPADPACSVGSGSLQRCLRHQVVDAALQGADKKDQRAKQHPQVLMQRKSSWQSHTTLQGRLSARCVRIAANYRPEASNAFACASSHTWMCSPIRWGKVHTAMHLRVRAWIRTA